MVAERDFWRQVNLLRFDKECRYELEKAYNEIVLSEEKTLLLCQILEDLKKKTELNTLKVGRAVNVEKIDYEEKNVFIIALIFHCNHLEKLYMKLGIEYSIFLETVSELPRKMRLAVKEGKSIFEINLLWLEGIFTFRILKIGRLQYAFGRLDDPLYVFQNKENGAIIAFLKDEGVNNNSYIQKEKDAALVKKSNIMEDDYGYEGVPILRNGEIAERKVRLSKSEWDIMLYPGCKVLDVHIPNGEKLELGLCIKSFKKSKKLADRIGYSFKGYRCRSWLMGTSLTPFLEKEWNIYQFQQMFYRYPCLRDSKEIWKRVFNTDKKPPTNYKANTKLQARILEGYAQGEEITGGGGFRLANVDK